MQSLDPREHADMNIAEGERLALYAVDIIESYFIRHLPTTSSPQSPERINAISSFLDLYFFSGWTIGPSDWVHHMISEEILSRSNLTPRQKVTFLMAFTSSFVSYWTSDRVEAYKKRGERTLHPDDSIEEIKRRYSEQIQRLQSQIQ